MSYRRIHHHIQADIFAKLRHNKSVRYKDLKEPGLEPSQFYYHLKDLMAQDMVLKNDDGSYSLAPLGMRLAQHFSSARGNFNEAPAGYTLVFLRSTDKRWFIVKRGKHPYFDSYACISGKIHMGETIEEAAKRELHNQTMGTVDVPLEYRGMISISVQEKDLLTHIVGPIWFADGVEATDPLPRQMHGSEIMWADWKKLPYEEFIPGWKEIIEMLESGKTDYLDLRFSDK